MSRAILPIGSIRVFTDKSQVLLDVCRIAGYNNEARKYKIEYVCQLTYEPNQWRPFPMGDLDLLYVNKGTRAATAQELNHLKSVQPWDQAKWESKHKEFLKDMASYAGAEEPQYTVTYKSRIVPPTPRPVGRRALVNQGVPLSIAYSQDVEGLVTQLRESTDQSTKRRIRAQLRKLGHRGGAR